MEKFIRLEEHLGGELISIHEFMGEAVNNSNVFRKSTGTCTRLFSKVLRECINRGSVVTIYRGGMNNG